MMKRCRGGEGTSNNLCMLYERSLAIYTIGSEVGVPMLFLIIDQRVIGF